jgi:hypothetical protein
VGSHSNVIPAAAAAAEAEAEAEAVLVSGLELGLGLVSASARAAARARSSEAFLRRLSSAVDRYAGCASLAASTCEEGEEGRRVCERSVPSAVEGSVAVVV